MQQTVILTLLDLISLKGIFSFGYVLFVLITIGVIIHDKRDPVKALSWIVVLILLPVAGSCSISFSDATTAKRSCSTAKNCTTWNRSTR